MTDSEVPRSTDIIGSTHWQSQGCHGSNGSSKATVTPAGPPGPMRRPGAGSAAVAVSDRRSSHPSHALNQAANSAAGPGPCRCNRLQVTVTYGVNANRHYQSRNSITKMLVKKLMLTVGSSFSSCLRLGPLPAARPGGGGAAWSRGPRPLSDRFRHGILCD